MKSLVMVAATATALLGACASPPTDANRTMASTAEPNAYGRDVDAKRVDAINRAARTNGVDVHWINYPEARPNASAGPKPVPTGT